jgi:hypothetical protein
MNVTKEINCCDCNKLFLATKDEAFSKLSNCFECRHKKMLQTIKEDEERYGAYLNTQ